MKPHHLELARQGRDAWNKWRRENPDEPVDFFGVDFTALENQNICFAEFDFGDGADFRQARFGDLPDNLYKNSAEEILISIAYNMMVGVGVGVVPIFFRATFGERASFDGATFGKGACFDSVTFKKGASFSGAKFGDLADFSQAKFGENAIFQGAIFGHRANFSRATFGDRANFSKVTFGNRADFSSVFFGKWISYLHCIFAQEANFRGAFFDKHADFRGIIFGKFADFCFAWFDEQANFCGSIFGEKAIFRYATFGKLANFSGVTFGKGARFIYTDFGAEAHFDGMTNKEVIKYFVEQFWTRTDEAIRERFETSWQEAEPKPSGLGGISYYGAKFHGNAYFVNRNLDGEVDFAFARFDQPPDFRGVKGYDNLNWASIRFGFRGEVLGVSGWTTNEQTSTRIRRLRKIATDILALDAERDLLILQRMAERGILWKNNLSRPWRALGPTVLMGMYRLFSNCGRSMILPLFWIFVSNGGAYLLYKLRITPGAQPEAVTDALWIFTLANAMPINDAPQQSLQQAIKLLFGEGVIPPWVQVVSTLQGIFSALLIFLLLLAMRNYFRFK